MLAQNEFQPLGFYEMRRVILAMLCVYVLSVSGGRTLAGELVVNGGFETGDFTGWTLIGAPSNNFVGTDFPHSGIYDAVFGQSGSLGSLSQTLATTIDTPYTLSFWFAGDGDTPSEFTASIGGKLLLDLVNPPLDTTYHQYIYDFTATSTSTVLSFGFRDDVFFINLDDVSVVPATAVPEPTSMIPLGIGMASLAGYAGYRWRTSAGH
jgi:hypothetical protein